MNARRASVFVLLLTFLPAPSTAGPPQPADPIPAPPKFRLPATARPIAYAVDLSITPSESSFRGSIDIDLRLRERTRILWLNGTELSIERATASFAGRPVGVAHVPVNEDFVGFSFDRPVGPGALKLHVSYSGKLREKETQGLFRQKDGDSWYAFTQFETSDARRAFPCFDEPSFKVPWQLTLRVPNDHVAVSNTPVAGESSGADGRKAVRFRRTAPLPSYLVAFGVGPFELADAGTAGAKKTPIRIVVPRGKTDRARYAAQTTGPLLERLEDYFGTPYPYEKLDVLVIPQTVFFGAMENPGLITFAERYSLATPAEQTVSFERFFASVQAHEIAHQWFGDLVTPAWWDDIWLNESFATWMSYKILIAWKPEWDEDVSRVNSRSSALGNDALATAYKVRQPVEDEHGLRNAFSAVSYAKGGALLSMFESWIGEVKFRAGIRRFLAAHRFGNASSADFLRAIEAESTPGVARAFSSFLDQAGAPLVEVSVACGPTGPARVELSQRRLLPIGSSRSATQTWKIPVCARFGRGDKVGRACTLLTQRTGAISIAPGGCPDWLLANEGEVGYYRALYRGDLLDRLLAAGERLTIPERNGLLRDAVALVETGELPMGKSFELATRFANDPSRHLAYSSVRLARVGEPLVPDELRPAYARFVSRTFSARARALGFAPKPGDDADTRLLRTRIVQFTASEGDDPQLQAQAKELALLWLADRKAVDAEIVSDVLTVAAEKGDRALFDRFHDAAKKSPERLDRERLLHAMGSFRDPAILKDALAIILTDEFDPREASELLFAPVQQPSSRAILWEFVKKNFDAIVARTPAEGAGALPYVALEFCDESARSDVEGFLRDRVQKLQGGPHNLDVVLERIGLCAALKQAQGGEVRNFLEKY